jgi:hypothetical protein
MLHHVCDRVLRHYLTWNDHTAARRNLSLLVINGRTSLYPSNTLWFPWSDTEIAICQPNGTYSLTWQSEGCLGRAAFSSQRCSGSKEWAHKQQAFVGLHQVVCKVPTRLEITRRTYPGMRSDLPLTMLHPLLFAIESAVI